MARFSIIVNGRVDNHAEASPAYAAEQGWIPAGESQAGDYWDPVTGYSPGPGEPLAQRQAERWEQIKAERDRRKWAGVKVGAHWFHSDDPSRIQFLALDLKGVPPGLYWKTLTLTPPPVFVLMTDALADQISTAIMASDAAIFQAAEVHRLAMEAIGNPESYDFTAGWPLSIGETP